MRWETLGLPERLREASAGRSIRASDDGDPVDDGLADVRDEVEILELLGKGGMGIVHRARQRALNRDVAIKRLRPEASEAAAARLCREARITGSLEHPNILPIHALGVGADGRPSVLMKRVSGVSYEALLADPEHAMWRTLPEDRWRAHVETLSGVCRALEFAHSRGVLHRDVKPANVMLGEFGEVFLLDWGIALRVGEAPQKGVVGTPAYMAPEMIEQGPFTPRTDVYLVGATLFHALSGRPLHAGGRFVDVVEHILEGPPVELGPDVPPELARICARATAREPEARFRSVRELREALQAALEHRASVALTTSAEARGAVIGEAGADEATVRRAFDEARFALAEALRIWPENAEARRLATSVRGAMFDFEVRAGNAGAAEALLAELEAPDPARAAQLDLLRTQQASRAQRTEALERGAAERDPRVGARTRRLAFAGLGGLLLAATFALSMTRIVVDYPQQLTLQVMIGVGSVAILALLWRSERHNTLSRQLAALGVFTYAYACAFTAIGWGLGLPIVQLLLLECFAVLPAFLFGGFVLDRRVLFGAPVLIFGVVFGMVSPTHAGIAVPIASCGGVIAAALALWLDAPAGD
ncbi:MAG: serine/threonine protein kinase [Deltaproteobacteria bacterium]|nr:serine/threonine protein kinase [Deltaproteobacteria bacterium]